MSRDSGVIDLRISGMSAHVYRCGNVSAAEIKGRSVEDVKNLPGVQDMGFLGVGPIKCYDETDVWISTNGVEHNHVVEFNSGHTGFRVCSSRKMLPDGVYLVELLEDGLWEFEPVQSGEDFSGNLLFLGANIDGRYCMFMNTFQYEETPLIVKSFKHGPAVGSFIYVCGDK